MHGIHVRPADFIPDFAHIKRAFFLGLPASIDMSARALGIMVMTFLVASFGTTDARGLRRGRQHPAGRDHPGHGPVDGGVGPGRPEHRRRQYRPRRLDRPAGRGAGLRRAYAFGLLVFLFPTQLVAFFVPADAAVIAEGARFLRIMALSWGSSACSSRSRRVPRVRQHGDQHDADHRVAVGAAVPAGLCAVQAHDLGAEGIFWSVPIANVRSRC